MSYQYSYEFVCFSQGYQTLSHIITKNGILFVIGLQQHTAMLKLQDQAQYYNPPTTTSTTWIWDLLYIPTLEYHDDSYESIKFFMEIIPNTCEFLTRHKGTWICGAVLQRPKMKAMLNFTSLTSERARDHCFLWFIQARLHILFYYTLWISRLFYSRSPGVLLLALYAFPGILCNTFVVHMYPFDLRSFSPWDQ